MPESIQARNTMALMIQAVAAAPARARGGAGWVRVPAAGGGGGWVERAGGEVRAHADGDRREAEPPVGGVLVEEDAHRERAEQQLAERDDAREPRDGQQRDPDRAGELLSALGGFEAGEM